MATKRRQALKLRKMQPPKAKPAQSDWVKVQYLTRDGRWCAYKAKRSRLSEELMELEACGARALRIER